MRCPKCSYISFDDRQNCQRCDMDLQQLAADLHGTAFSSSAPTFLAAALEVQEESAGREDLAALEFAGDEEEMELAEEDLPVEGEEDLLLDEDGAAEEGLTSEDNPEAGEADSPAAEAAEGSPVAEAESPAGEPAVEDSPVAEADSPAGGEVALDFDLDLGLEPEAAAPASAAPSAGEGEEDLLDLGSLSGPSTSADGDRELDLVDLAVESAPAPAATKPAAATELFSLDEEEPAGPSTEEVAWPEDQEVEDITDLLGDASPAAPAASPAPTAQAPTKAPTKAPASATGPAAAPPAQKPGPAEGLALSLDNDDAPLGAAAPPEEPPKIDDLGLSLEVTDEDKK